jgi:monoamine oxidase
MNFSHFNALSFSGFFNLHHFIEEPILIGFSGGDKAAHIENFTDDAIIDYTMTDLKKVFGNDIAYPESYSLSRWGKDTYSYGSYSYTPINSSGVDYEELSNPISNRLFFAGEATTPTHPANTHGAYLSGIREAERIIGIIG